jgi:hypothetical protein
LIVLQAGCVGPAAPPPGPIAWHQLTSGCYNTQEGRFIYGIGRAGGIQNSTLLRAAADNRSRKELAAALEKYVVEVARAVPGDTDPQWAMLTYDERRLILGGVVREAMQRAVVSGHWSEPRKGGLLALCRLSLSDFKNVLSASGALDATMRSAMVAAAERVHARLARKL